MMKEDILDLPPELGYQIYKYCHKPDLINFACCSQSHYNSVKYLLYNIIRIPWKIVEMKSFRKEELDNLKFVTALRFVTYDFNSLFNKVIWNSISENYQQILLHTDPNMFTSLELESIIINVENVIEILLPNNLQEISLMKCFGISVADWNYIGRLSCLRKLTIDQCSIADWDIENIVKGSTLQELNLIKCSGITEDSLTYLTSLLKLRKLKIVNCQDISPDGYIYLGDLINLTELSLLDIDITDFSLASFTKLKYMKYLQVNCCPTNQFDVSDIGLSYLTGISTLEKLDINWKYIGDNGFSHFPNLISLTRLNISGCNKVSDNGFLRICKLTTLTYLNVSSCENLTDDGIIHIINLKSLKVLDLSGCTLLTDVSVNHISKLTLLENLYLCQCVEITDEGLDHICSLTKLRQLDISGCYDVTDFGLFHIYYYIQFLEVLKLMGCTKITNVGLSYLKSLKLQHLDISLDLFSGQGKCMKVNDVGVSHVSSITSLRQLNISCCDYISDDALNHISTLTFLNILNLSCCIKISDNGLLYLSCLQFLKDLNISMCVKVSDIGIGYICKMRSLKKLDFHGCSAVTDVWPSLYPYIIFKYRGLK